MIGVQQVRWDDDIVTTTNRQQIQRDLKSMNFGELFVNELGWDRVREPALIVNVRDAGIFTLRPLVEKRGMKVLVCDVGTDALPEQTVLRKIERAVKDYAYEHIIIYHNRGEQVWQWVKREPGKPLAPRHFPLHANQSGQFLAERLQRLNVDIAEEGDDYRRAGGRTRTRRLRCRARHEEVL